MNHETILSQFDLQVSLMSAKNQMSHSKLRDELAEKYGEDGVQKVERSVENKRESEYARHRS